MKPKQTREKAVLTAFVERRIKIRKRLRRRPKKIPVVSGLECSNKTVMIITRLRRNRDIACDDEVWLK